MEYLSIMATSVGSVINGISNVTVKALQDTDMTWLKEFQKTLVEGMRFTWTELHRLTAEGLEYAVAQFKTAKLYADTNWSTWQANVWGLLSLILNQKTLVGFTCVVMVLSILNIIFNVVIQVSSKLKNNTPLKRNISTMTIFDLAKTAYVRGHTEAVMAMLQKNKYDINYRLPSNGLSLFLCACLSGERQLIEYLLENGADINILTEEGDSPLYLATFGLLCSSQPNMKVLKILVEAGCDINQQNRKGYTPLHRAANKGSIEMIEYLLQQGANTNICSASGVYPIDSALSAGHLDAAELLETDVPDCLLTDQVEPFTPPRIHMGLQSPRKKHLVESNVRRRSGIL